MTSASAGAGGPSAGVGGASDAGGPAPIVEAPEPPPLPPLLLRDGLPEPIMTGAALARAVEALAAGTGPIALDTERASGYRYSGRAYLVQVRRTGAGTFLIDPIAVPRVPGLAEALTGPEWVLHAASQDLPCLAELGLAPTELFDTELAGRLLDMPRVGLAPMVEALLGHALAKGHGAADWSTRPLPGDWLEYAALDVEVLVELREILTGQLREAGKWEWAVQEFAAVRDAPPPPPRVDPWRRTSGLHAVRRRRGLAIVAALWTARDEVARAVDTAPGRLLPDSSIVAAAREEPRDVAALFAIRDFHGRAAKRHRHDWGRALDQAWALPEADLPASTLVSDTAPPARAWPRADPAAAARLGRARAGLRVLAEEHQVPVENLITPDTVRQAMWRPPVDMPAFLTGRGARPWQVTLTSDALAAAVDDPPEAQSV